ncbi:hypothetical protein [Brevundimonas faecalis]|uniref:Uncharacterized protein n=1 Tax=Brevundimonas faecalis TaxID=947378 RepID=A0ABV2RCM9_9CAUL
MRPFRRRSGPLLTDAAREILAGALVVLLALIFAGAAVDAGEQPLSPSNHVRSR